VSDIYEEELNYCAQEFLLRPEFSELRASIGELERFHGLVISAVTATDVDKELREGAMLDLSSASALSGEVATSSRRLLSCLNHMMQAADVSHDATLAHLPPNGTSAYSM
jgi:hypothetical protein